jgi:hypothetical protein
MKTSSPSSRTEQDSKAEEHSGKEATMSSNKPSSGQHAANHSKAGKSRGAGGGTKQQHGAR